MARAEEGRWSKDLMKAALSRGETVGPDGPRTFAGSVPDRVPGRIPCATLSLGDLVNEYLVAFRVQGRPGYRQHLCYIPIENSNNFSMLVHGIAQMFQTGKPSHPRGAHFADDGALVSDESASQGTSGSKRRCSG
jgi:hypothetical protein